MQGHPEAGSYGLEPLHVELCQVKSSVCAQRVKPRLANGGLIFDEGEVAVIPHVDPFVV
jgi:hypothetical protein